MVPFPPDPRTDLIEARRVGEEGEDSLLEGGAGRHGGRHEGLLLSVLEVGVQPAAIQNILQTLPRSQHDIKISKYVYIHK